MYKIIEKKCFNPTVTLMEITAPRIARRAEPGQFIILRVDDEGERIPLTIAGYDRERGTVTIVFQIVGATTEKLNTLNVGDKLCDFTGPLGRPTDVSGIGSAVVIGGGLGCAIAYPVAKKLHENGCKLDSIIGFRSAGLVFFEKEFAAISNNFSLMTDDGSAGQGGLVTNALEQRIAAGAEYDAVIAIGPLPMMKYVSLLTKEYGIRTIVSMNPIMIDGTGMCGGCRLTVGGETKFACVDGPEFDGHLVDFDEALLRSSTYRGFEREAHERACRIYGEGRDADDR